MRLWTLTQSLILLTALAGLLKSTLSTFVPKTMSTSFLNWLLSFIFSSTYIPLQMLIFTPRLSLKSLISFLKCEFACEWSKIKCRAVKNITSYRQFNVNEFRYTRIWMQHVTSTFSCIPVYCRDISVTSIFLRIPLLAHARSKVSYRGRSHQIYYNNNLSSSIPTWDSW